MSTHNICFYGELKKIIPELSPNILFNMSSDTVNVMFTEFLQVIRLYCVYCVNYDLTIFISYVVC